MKTAALALVFGSLVGCTGLIDGGGSGGGTPEERVARDKWISKALPQISPNCGACHNGAQPGIDFLAGDSDMGIRDTLIAFDPGVVNFDAPQASRLLTKGPHNGPGFTTEQASAVLEWLNAEKDALPDPGDEGPILVTAQFAPQYCSGGDPGSATCPINTVDLTPVGVAGGKITFVAQALSSGLYLNNLAVEGATEGIYIEHPLFTSYLADGRAVVDTIDRYYAVKMNLMANIKEPLQGGTAAFVGFGAGAGDKLEIRFKAIKIFQVEGMGSGSGSGSGEVGGCKVLASFKANAGTQLTNSCGGCHAGAANPNAKSAMNIDGANSADDAVAQLACNQVRTRINFQNTDLSGFYVAPNPGDPTNHPFKFNGNQANFNAFKAAVDPWVQAEKTAP
ncbi:MAG: hypothetical protein H0T79_10815 [Deltaproteobacteria bacterium]|nr:hypothetical protein [Deltaproteobacteria bacterium]